MYFQYENIVNKFLSQLSAYQYKISAIHENYNFVKKLTISIKTQHFLIYFRCAYFYFSHHVGAPYCVYLFVIGTYWLGTICFLLWIIVYTWKSDFSSSTFSRVVFAHLIVSHNALCRIACNFIVKSRCASMALVW